MSTNPLSDLVEELKNEIKELEENNYEDCIQAIQFFCADCPIKGQMIKCSDCYLFEYKDIEIDTR